MTLFLSLTPYFSVLPDVVGELLFAHQVELSEEVGGTLHVEPNDTPRTGETTLAWFALVRKGGQALPLEACDCQLSVYVQPRQPADQPVLTPSLRPLSAEGYVNIPSAEMIFPAVGQYELVISGKSSVDEAFTPFELTFEVLVTAGKEGTSPDSSLSTAANSTTGTTSRASTIPGDVSVGTATTSDNIESSSGALPLVGWVGVAIATSLLAGLIYAWIRFRNRS